MKITLKRIISITALDLLKKEAELKMYSNFRIFVPKMLKLIEENNLDWDLIDIFRLKNFDLKSF